MTRPANYLHHHWAKSDRQNPSCIHLLEHHLADVGACFEALLLQPTIRKRLARTAGTDDLDEVTLARLCVFATLHDIGKANVGFQTRIWRGEDLQGKRKPGWAGHTSDIVPVLEDKDTTTADWFFKALGWDDFLAWDDRDGLIASGLFVATLSHHGDPLNLHNTKSANPDAWKPFGELSPQTCVERIGSLARSWFPQAFTIDGPPLPSAPEFQHMFLGLCTLADWIGSNEDHFPYVDEPDDDYMDTTARRQARNAIKAIGLNISEQRDAFKVAPSFSELFDIGYAPNAIQKAAWDAPIGQPVAIIESETGSGKTEAALWRFAKMYEAGLVDGLYFALPTRAAATQMHGRVNRFIESMFRSHKPEPVLAVPGYIRAGDFTGEHLADYKVWWDTHPRDNTTEKLWAAESAKRFLAAQIAVGTVDQAMMAALQVRHSHMRAACLARNLLIVDEVHASDPYMSAILTDLLNAHVGAGGYALLMSATLGSAARSRWLFRPRRESQIPQMSISDAVGMPYPSISTKSGDRENIVASGENEQQKNVRIDARPRMHEFSQVAGLAIDAARAGAKVLVIRNTVAYAVNTHRALEDAAGAADTDLLFACNGVITLHTGRFAANDRDLLDGEVEAQLGKQRDSGGRIVVGTQTLEQSLDIDADLLITDLCPVDVLLQRIGRLHRHRRDDRPNEHGAPTCVVLTPPGDNLDALLSSDAGASRNGLGGFVYPDLRILELTLRLVSETSSSDQVWRIPDMNRELVERATHPEALEALVEEMGDDWRVHAITIAGEQISDNLTAHGAVVKRDKTFLDRGVGFPSNMEERIRTRLGDEGVEVRFEPAAQSPLDSASAIASLNIPGHMCRGITPEETVVPDITSEGFQFTIGGRRFAYDRLGLRMV